MQTFRNGQAFSAASVSFGIQQATAQPVDVRIYTNSGAPFPNGTLTKVASTTVTIVAQSGTVLTVPIAFTIPAAALEAVLELHTATAVASQATFFNGSNHVGQT